ncbi:sugar translocase [Acidianus manzaensis]|uniref:Sugar translocase n=1 Tax=Acidianus manzaensis TaxID=282676 RepID=A0A1W6K3L2_9CREN|nr:sugar translocase [Acidianus manzaensis]
MIVGGGGVIVNEGIFISLSRFIPIVFSLALAIEASVIFNFILNDLWTFADARKGSFLKRMIRFHASSYSGGIVHYTIVILLLVILLHFSSLSEIVLLLFFSYLKLQALYLAAINFVGIVFAFAVRFITAVKYVWG